MPNSGPLVISWFVLCRQSAVHSGRVRVEIKVKSPDSRLIIHVVRVQIRVGVGSMHGLGIGPDSHADSWRLLCSSRASCFPFNRSYRRLRQFFCFSYFVFLYMHCPLPICFLLATAVFLFFFDKDRCVSIVMFSCVFAALAYGALTNSKASSWYSQL